MSEIRSFFKGKRVLVTGHTGFKGSWLSLVLSRLGAELMGFSLPPDRPESLFEVARVGLDVEGEFGDIREFGAIKSLVGRFRPDVIFHMAAQPLVLDSFQDPIGTYATNVLGTVNLLEAVRASDSVGVVINVTTDKCYENREWVWSYRETDRLGGHDPYSSSKACSELVSEAYSRSFLSAQGCRLATARAGNVIGGGDWSPNRLVPDILRAVQSDGVLEIRNGASVRPWQHVLDPLNGYLLLASKLSCIDYQLSGSWNFGPSSQESLSVSELVDRFQSSLGVEVSRISKTDETQRESKILRLDSTKAHSILGWTPKWSLNESVDQTCAWYREWESGGDMRRACLAQIEAFYQD